MAKKLEFISDPRNRYISYNHAMDLQTKYYDGKDEEREEQRQKYYQSVLKRFKMNYSEDSDFLIDLSLEDYEEIYEMIIDNASIELVKEYVESVKY